MSNSILLYRDSPRRPADWRWQRAINALTHDKFAPSRSKDGVDSYTWIKRGMDFLAMQRAATTEEAQHSLREAFPDIFEAFALYNDVSSASRYYLEALLLAHDSETITVATLMSLSSAQVVAYEALFFNVSDRRLSDVYVMDTIIDMARDVASNFYFQDKVLKLIAFRMGWRSLNHVITGINKLPAATNLEQIRGSITEGVADLVGAKTLSMLGHKLRTPLHEGDVMLLGLFKSFEEFRRDIGAGAGAQDQISLAVRSMFEATQIYVGSKAVNSKARTLEFDSTAVELRQNESLLLGQGEDIPNLEDLRNLTFESIVEENNTQ